MPRNNFEVEGWLQDDVELKFGKDSGKAYSQGTLAYRERVKEGDTWKNGPTSWFAFVAFGHNAEILSALPEGTQVCLSGKVTIDYWEDKETGARRSKPVITVFQLNLPIFTADALDVTEDFISLRRFKGQGKRGGGVPQEVRELVDGEEPF